MRIRLAVFDMVGTTVEAGGEVPLAFREAFRSVLGIHLTDDAIRQIRGRSKPDAISALLAAHDLPTAERPEMARLVYERLQEGLRREYRSHVRAVPGADAAFAFLIELGIKVVLTTGLDHDSAHLLLRCLGWEEVGFTGLVSGDDVTRGRPAPDLIYAAMRLAGVVDPATVLVAGDTVSDLEAAAAAEAGVSIGVLTGAHSRSVLQTQPHAVILESVADLPRWLTSIGLAPPERE